MYYQDLNNCGVWMTEAACLYDALENGNPDEYEKEDLRQQLDQALEESTRLISRATTELKHLASAVEFETY